MRSIVAIVPLCTLFFATGCQSACDSNEASNRMLALGRVQARMFATGGDGVTKFAAAIQTESAPISELIAAHKYDDACRLADEIAAKYKIDLKKERDGMVTVEQLAKDGGKGGGSCSIADAAKKQMELHQLLQKEIEAGRQTPAILQKFNNDTRSYGELLTTNPGKACELLDRVKKDYGL